MTRAVALSISAIPALFLAGLAPRPASAHSADPPPSLASDPGHTPGPTDDPGGWHLLYGRAYRDTVPAGAQATLRASAAALESDHWVLAPHGAATHLLSSWKPIHHVLFRLFSGRAFGRVFIDVTPLTEVRSEVRFQGVLATRRDIRHNPARGWAERAYASAVRDWQKEMRDGIAYGPWKRP